MRDARCGNFSIEPEEIYVTGAPVVLRVPLRRCALAERMIELIAQTERGNDVARKLSIDAGDGADSSTVTYVREGRTEEKRIRAAFGPDLEAIHSTQCTIDRCEQSCTPSFKMILLQFGLRLSADSHLEPGCLDGRVSHVETLSVPDGE